MLSALRDRSPRRTVRHILTEENALRNTVITAISAEGAELDEARLATVSGGRACEDRSSKTIDMSTGAVGSDQDF